MQPILRRVAVAAFALSAAGLLAGCGGGGSTASSTPSLSTSAAAAGQSTTGMSPLPAPPAGMPSNTGPAAPTAPSIGPKEQTYLAALKQAGITPSGNGENAVSIANYICQGLKQGATDDQLLPFVGAMAGSDAQQAGQKLDDAALATQGKAYVSVAKSTYCQ